MSLLRVNQLKKSFPSVDGESTQIVDVDEFYLKEAEFCGMHGESGSGKTTFLHLLAGILSPDSGEIEWLRQNVGLLSPSERDGLRASAIGYVFQTFNLLQGFTTLENLKIAMSFAGSSKNQYAIDLLARVGLSKRLHYYPHQLSIGQQQRVALARALVNQPKLVLADEPTGNLDEGTADAVFEMLLELNQRVGTALVMVTHDSRLAARMDKVYRLEAGVLKHD